MQIGAGRFSGLTCWGCLDYLLAGYLVSFMASGIVSFLLDGYDFRTVTLLRQQWYLVEIPKESSYFIKSVNSQSKINKTFKTLKTLFLFLWFCLFY